MKLKLLLPFFVLLFMSMQCDNDTNSTTITQEMLDTKKQEILDYIASFSCTNASSCNYIAFGSKPCGGPWEYLAFPSTVNLQELQSMVATYNQMQHQHNIQTNAVSDCLLVAPPNTLDCQNNVCVIID